jgi:hypothetical protein
MGHALILFVLRSGALSHIIRVRRA